MRDRIFNGVTLLAVAAAVILTLLRGGGAVPSQDAGLPFSPVPPAASATAAPHPAQAYRQRRAEVRQQEQAMLRILLDSAATTPETRALAQEQALLTVAQQETELAVEAALVGRGYENALCVVRQGEATVFTGAPLTAQDAALVQQLILEASGIAPENIRLSGF